MPTLIADKVGGLNAAYATMGAVIHKLRTGRGQFVEVPMFEAFTHFLLKDHLAGKAFDPPVGSLLYARQIEPDRQPFATKDGHIAVVPYSDADWVRIFAEMGASDVLEKEPVNTPVGRRQNTAILYQGIAANMPNKTTAQWLEILQKARIACMPVRDIDDILEDPHLKATEFFKKREHPTEGTIYEMSDASRFSDWERPEQEGAPLVGQHTEEVKRKIGK